MPDPGMEGDRCDAGENPDDILPSAAKKVFQTLEKSGKNFPRFGKIEHYFSKVWKKTGNIFQTLEKSPDYFPNLGKYFRGSISAANELRGIARRPPAGERKMRDGLRIGLIQPSACGARNCRGPSAGPRPTLP